MKRFFLFAGDIKLSHTVFAMPFALLATFLAAAQHDRWPSILAILLIVLAMVFARTCAMSANRYFDRVIDIHNPRTQQRALPSGQLTAKYMLVAGILSALGLMASASGFWFLDHNPWPILLSPAVILWLSFYSLLKRWTWLCHLFLGTALGISPLAASIAIEPTYLATAGPYWLAAMVLCWVAGFDVIYALQDVDSDKQTGIYSLPASLSVGLAVWVSRILHLASILALVMLWRTSPLLHTFFLVGIALTAAILLLEHILIHRSQTKHMHMAFFTLNGIISLLLGCLGMVDIVIHL